MKKEYMGISDYEIVALLNKIGGREGVDKLLIDELKIIPKEIVCSFELHALMDEWTIEEVLQCRANLDEVDPSINTKNFPCSRRKTCENRETFLFQFDKDMSAKEIIVFMKENGYRPARIRELIEFSGNYPCFHGKFAGIVALGSRLKTKGENKYYDFPFLREHAGKLLLQMRYDAEKFMDSYSFLAVRK